MTDHEMNDQIRKTLPSRIRRDNPAVTDEYLRRVTEQALAVGDNLKEELLAWIDDRPFRGYRVRDKYTVEIAMQTRNDRRDVVGAVFALDAYEKDERKEGLLWRIKR